MLPRAIFRHLEELFETTAAPQVEIQPEELGRDLSGWIASAWRSGDAWLRACAVRASRWATGLDPSLFDIPDTEAGSIVRAELRAVRTPSEEAPSWILTPRPLSP